MGTRLYLIYQMHVASIDTQLFIWIIKTNQSKIFMIKGLSIHCCSIWGLTDFLQYQKGGLQQQTKKRDSDLWDFKRIHHLIVAASIISLWANRSIFSLLQKSQNQMISSSNSIFSDASGPFSINWRRHIHVASARCTCTLSLWAGMAV